MKLNNFQREKLFYKKDSQVGHAKSEPIHVFEVEVRCTQGTLKVNEKVCRRRMEVTYILLYI